MDRIPETVRFTPEQLAELDQSPPVLMTWHEGEQFIKAQEPAHIADVLIGAFHGHLRGAKIAYLFRERMKSKGRIVLGKAKLASPLIDFLVGLDFVLEFNFTAWKELSKAQRIALVDHELAHCHMDDNEKWVVLPHDLEEFHAIVGRWGIWNRDVQRFRDVLTRQLELLPA